MNLNNLKYTNVFAFCVAVGTYTALQTIKETEFIQAKTMTKEKLELDIERIKKVEEDLLSGSLRHDYHVMQYEYWEIVLQ